MAKRVLLTGASGFIGSHCVQYFLDNTDWEILALDSFRHKGTCLRLAELDTANLPTVTDAIQAVTDKFAFTVANQVDIQ